MTRLRLLEMTEDLLGMAATLRKLGDFVDGSVPLVGSATEPVRPLAKLAGVNLLLLYIRFTAMADNVEKVARRLPEQ